MFTFNQMLKVLFSTLILGSYLTSSAVTLSQTPLLTQKGSVEPNLVIALDTSGSMNDQFVYQFGGDETNNGRAGPKNPSVTAMLDNTGDGRNTKAVCSGTYSITITCTYRQPVSTDYWLLSPDVNLLAYDPRIRYKVRVDSTGTADVTGSTTASAAGVTAYTGTFNVYFYKNSTTNINETWQGKISNSSGVDETWSTTNKDREFAPHKSPVKLSAYFAPNIPANSWGTKAESQLIAGAETGLVYPNEVSNSYALHLPKFVNRTDCTGTRDISSVTYSYCTLVNEQKNYAIWKKYHSNRLDLVKTGLGWAFDQFGPTLRLGWGTIDDLNGGSLNKAVNLLTPAHKSLFYTWLYSQDAGGGTPSMEAVEAMGKYYARVDNKGPWATTPNASSTCTSSTTCGTVSGETNASRKNHYSCRRSYGMLITDGYYDGTTLVGNVDGTASATITGSSASGSGLTYSYNGTTRPYPGGGSNTMADIVMKYWVTDLRPGLSSDSSNSGIDNKVKKIADTVVAGVITRQGNESFWQNMSFYGVGLGVYGTLPQTEAVLNNIRNNIPNINSVGTSVSGWPTAAQFAEESIDDMWHATVNGRGRMLSAKNSDTLSDGIEGMLAEINRDTSSQSGVAASTISLTSATNKYTPKYTTGSWTGNVIASDLDAGSGAELCTLWKVVGPIDSALDKPSCSSTTTWNGIAAHGSRNIYAWNGSAMGSFDISNTYVTSNVAGGTSANLINYLRGDQTNEDPNGTSQYRAREVVLGDIVNSTPTYIQGALDMRLAKDVSTAVLSTVDMYATTGYGTFVNTKAARSPGVLFAGANDGMLHGFNGNTGEEVFAFVPRAVMPNMHLLANRSYNHTYYVDGPTVETDACFTGGDSCTTWTNLLLGTAGAGGKTVFALDVTHPMSMNAASVKWEITTATTGYNNLGNIIHDVQSGITRGGQWVAIFGNGYTGADGKAHLYVANLDTGDLIADIPAGVASSNGLGGVRLVRDSKKRIVGAYAGDLNGSLWKFDLSNTSPSSWTTSMPQLLYKTMLTPVQPITATPTVVKHPTSGNVVAFGTGKFIESTDLANADVQTLYGVWDNVAFGAASPTVVTQVDKTNLVQQTISAAITGSNIVTAADLSTSTAALNYYAVSRNPIDWTTKKGWYINLTNAGQRTIYPLETLAGTIAAVDTISPSNVSLDPCLVTGTGKAWNYVIDMVSGSGPSEAIFDTNGSGNITSADLLVSGYENAADGRTRYIKNIERSTSLNTYFTPLSTQQLPGFSLSCVILGNCPSTGTVKRTWRQLFLR